MNYYERHIGDYIRDTVSLSMLEDGAYNRLMDQYYQTERPLPLDKKMVYRLARATTTSERKAVDFVLDHFFLKEDDGYQQKRINLEIDRYQEKQRKAKASANARWNKNERNANASTSHDASVMRTHNEGNAHQAPDTRHHIKDKEAAASTPPPEAPESKPDAALPDPKKSETKPKPSADPIHSRAIELTALLRKRGANLQASDPRLRRWAETGVSDAQALQALEIAQQRREAASSASPINAGYLDTILSDLITPDGDTGKPGASKKTQEDRWWTSNAGVDRKARELGMFARGNEDYASFKDRIFDEIKRRQAQGDDDQEQSA